MNKKSPQGEEMRAKILEFLIKYIDLHNFAPSFREIMDGERIRSESTVLYHLRELERRGLIERTPKISRGISIPEKTRSDYLVSYKCLYPFGCMETSARPGDCRIHGTELVPFVTRRSHV
jgi:SOS-response transcriptional repressor LexA